MNQLILGDNLEILRNWESESVDLIYLDPPFFSNRNYEVIWGDEGEVRSFTDRWSGGIDHYIAWLKERVIELHRILKPTGSIFLHCDWHADAYIRVDILDKVFGYGNFKSEIIWERTFNSGSSKSISKKFPTNTDTIFWYSKTENYIFNRQVRPLNDGALKRYDKFDEKGRFMWVPLKTVSEKRLEELRKSGEIREGEGLKYPRYKKYLNEEDGVIIDNLWNDIGQVATTKGNEERIGYPTQKPEALLERIIKCASNEGDVVLDPFVGGGTTVAVADKLHRQWVGIDQSVQAIKVSEYRLYKQVDLFSQPFIVKLHKYDYDTLRYKDAFEFETFMVTQFGGTPNTKQRGDMGMDGKTQNNTPIQVKRSDGIGRNVVDNFLSAAKRYDKNLFDKSVKAKQPVGYIIAFSFGKGAVQEAARLKNKEGIIIELVAVEDIIPIALKPALQVEVETLGRNKKGIHDIKFTAKGTSNAGIEFYSWDFDFDPADPTFKAEVLRDTEGTQTYTFKPGLHHIAVKVIDNDGLENTEVIKLKVNGELERIN